MSVRSDDDASTVPSQDSSIPAVKEVLSTAKGTDFYVLTVAGPHGVTDQPGQIGEAMVMDPVTGQVQPTYLSNVTIPPDAMQGLRKM